MHRHICIDVYIIWLLCACSQILIYMYSELIWITHVDELNCNICDCSVNWIEFTVMLKISWKLINLLFTATIRILKYESMLCSLDSIILELYPSGTRTWTHNTQIYIIIFIQLSWLMFVFVLQLQEHIP